MSRGSRAQFCHRRRVASGIGEAPTLDSFRLSATRARRSLSELWSRRGPDLAAGYFVGGLRKLEAARAVAAHMALSRNSSPASCKLREILVELTGGGA